MLIYNLVIKLYGFIIFLASIKKVKAKQWVSGRKNWRQSYREKISKTFSEKRIWVHCASYGEFEQGRPLLEAIAAEHPDYEIILTFFSPSGFEAFKEWHGAKAILYLPLDTKENAADFLEIVKPQIAIFIKYEFWLNYLFELKKRRIDTFLVSAVFKPHHPFFKWYGGIFRRSLRTFKTLFIQDKNSALLLDSIDIGNYRICGDTRFDRVLEIKKTFKEIKQLKDFKDDGKLIIAGSTWLKDAELVLSAFAQIKDVKTKLVIVPHEVDEKSIRETVSKIEHLGLPYSLYSGTINKPSRVLVLDTMGLLSKSYFYADVAYVGGGFTDGLHNVLEPAVYGIPVTFYGDNYYKFNEALDMIKSGSAVCVKDTSELLTAFSTFLNDEKLRLEISKKLEDYFKANMNVTGKIMESIDFS